MISRETLLAVQQIEARAVTNAEAKQTLLRIVQPQARDRWMASAVRSYTPDIIMNVLRSALAGNLVAQWELFDLMEDTWPRLSKNLNELKDAVISQDWCAQPFAQKGQMPSAEAVRRAGLFETALWSMQPNPAKDENGFTGMLKDLMDAWGKGISVQEITWAIQTVKGKGALYVPRFTTWLNPRYYGYSSQGTELMLNLRELANGSSLAPVTNLLPDAGEGFAAFPPNKFLIGVAKQKTGHPAGAALLRPLAWWWCASNFSAEWFLNFAQIFGLPIRWATYDQNQPGLLNNICDMLENMGSAGWAAFPTGTDLELKEPAKSGSDNPQVSLLDRADKQCDLLILGQTLTSDVGKDGGSRALGDVHAGVLTGRKSALAAWVSEMLGQLTGAFCRLNFGDDSECPWLQAADETPQDAKAMAERDQIILKSGIPIPEAWFYERHDIPIPAEGEKVIGGQVAEEKAPSEVEEEEEGKPTKAVHAKLSAAQIKLGETVAERMAGVERKWLGGVRPFFGALVTMAKDTNVSDDELLAQFEKARKELPELFPLLDAKALRTELENAMSAAAINGAVNGHLTRRKGGRK